jgi:coenzyme PQQ precursor peptide PqqA
MGIVLLFITLSGRTVRHVHREGTIMRTWKSPKVVEIAVGMEINSYACARL